MGSLESDNTCSSEAESWVSIIKRGPAKTIPGKDKTQQGKGVDQIESRFTMRFTAWKDDFPSDTHV